MLSPASYELLRFQGRPERSDAAAGAHERPPSERPVLKASGASAPSRRAEPELADDERRLVTAILAAAGLDAAPYRSGPFRRRMPAVLRALRAGSAAAAVDTVARDPAQAQRALETLLIGHTEPFRDADTFNELRRQVLPPLCEGRTALQAWSVGCSSGVELLSTALLLAERGVLAGSVLQGSDCRAAAIASAKSHAVLRLLGALPREFDDLRPLAAHAEFGAAVASIVWVVEDATTAAPALNRWDLVFCRNLAIYFDVQSSQRLWARLVAALAPGGVLVTGRAERPPATLPLVRLAKCIYRLEGGTT
jgi:chemotaxis methyl-accepting protein methylase